jgi:hypothetical protein
MTGNSKTPITQIRGCMMGLKDNELKIFYIIDSEGDKVFRFDKGELHGN